LVAQLDESSRARRPQLQAELKQLDEQLSAYRNRQVFAVIPQQPPVSHVLVRGNVQQPGDALLDVRGLTKSFGTKRVVDNLSIDVRRGQEVRFRYLGAGETERPQLLEFLDFRQPRVCYRGASEVQRVQMLERSKFDKWLPTASAGFGSPSPVVTCSEDQLSPAGTRNNPPFA
jgi:ATPase subunit of ABC transporter with duplicated ATPase domains